MAPSLSCGCGMKVSLGSLFLCLVAVVSVESTSLARTFTVTSLADAGDGSLRAAIASANASSDPDVICFKKSLSGTIKLITGEIEVIGKLVIDGPGSSRIKISGNNSSRVFKIGLGTELSIDDVSIVDSRNTTLDSVGSLLLTRGGAILNDGGTLRLAGVTFLKNMTIGGDQADVVGGGAVVNSGHAMLIAIGCQFVGNVASGGSRYAFGGAIANVTNSIAYVENCGFVDNVSVSGQANYGGAIGNFGSSQLDVIKCSFANNVVSGTEVGETGFGGAIATRPGSVNNSGSSTDIYDSQFRNNQAIGANADVGQSGADAGGGALYNERSVLLTQDTQFFGNEAFGGCGGSDGGDALGGAISATGTDTEEQVTSIIRCHFTHNVAYSGYGAIGIGGLAAGGAIENTLGTLSLVQTVVVRNMAIGVGNGQGIGGGLYNGATVLADHKTIKNIVANQASTDYDDVYGTVTQN